MTFPAKRLLILAAAFAATTGLGVARAQDGLAGDLDDLLGLGENAKKPAEAAPAEAPAAAPAEAPAAAPAVVAPAEAPDVAAPAEAPVVVAPAEAPVVVAPAEAPVVVAPAEAPVVVAPAEAPAMAVPAEAPAVVAPAEAPAVEAPAVAAPAEAVIEAPAVVIEAPAVVIEAPAVMIEVPPAAPAAGAQESFVSDVETLEAMRRRALDEHGKTSLANARKALRDGDYQEAQKLYAEALTFISARPGNEQLRDEAEKGVAEAIYRNALLLWKKGDTGGAIQLARQARQKGHPKAPKLVSDIQYEIEHPIKEEPPKEAKRWNADQYKDDQKVVSRGLGKAREYYITGEYDKARAELEIILRDHPYDVDAMEMLKRVNERTYDVSSAELGSTRTRMIRDVRDTWNPRRYAIDTIKLDGLTGAAPTAGQPVGESGKTAEQEIREKMARIIVPEINFRAANINDVISFFESAAREFDSPEIPPDQRGVNFVLKVAGGAAPAAAAPAVDDPFAAPSAAAAGPSGVAPITFSARYVSLLDALKIVTDVAGMKFRIRGKVVMVMPSNIPDEDIVTRSYTVLPSLNERVMGVSRDIGAARAGGADAGGFAAAEITDTGRVDWKQFFTDMGVPWPEGSSISYIQSIGKLRVANTPENLAVLDKLLEELNVTPRQIEIEARFVEVSQTDLESIGFEWLLTDNWEVAQKNDGNGPEANGRVFVAAGSGSGGMRYANGDNPNTGIDSVADDVLHVASVLTNPELSFILHLLSQRQNTDLLSAPKVVTKNNQEAVIKVITEYIYPTEFSVEPIVAQSSAGTTTTQLQLGGLVEPSNFEMREVGVILQVVPEVSPEGQMIDLFLNPQIVSEPTWKNYGSTFVDPVSGQVISLPMEQPFFQVRSISTRISIYNGATVVMGGMITEVRNEVDDKIPVLGDIPLLGRLFRSRYEQSEKRNLLIFVTARLVDPAGRSLKSQQSETPVVAMPTP